MATQDAASNHLVVVDQKTNKLTMYDMASGALIAKTDSPLSSCAPFGRLVATSPAHPDIVLAAFESSIHALSTTDLSSVSSRSTGDGLSCLAFSSDGKYVAAGLAGSDAFLFETSNSGGFNLRDSGCEYIKMPIPKSNSMRSMLDGPGNDSVCDIAFSPSSTKLVTVSYFWNEVRLFTVPHASFVKRLCQMRDLLTSSIFISEHIVAFKSGDDSRLRVWSLDEDTESRVGPSHKLPISAVAISPDRRWIATGSADRDINILYAETCSRYRCTSLPKAIKSMCFIDNDTLFAGIEDSNMTAFNIHTGRILQANIHNVYPALMLSVHGNPPDEATCAAPCLFPAAQSKLPDLRSIEVESMLKVRLYCCFSLNPAQRL